MKPAFHKNKLATRVESWIFPRRPFAISSMPCGDKSSAAELTEAITIMTAVPGTYKNGHIILDAPADWPEGCRVIVEPAPQGEPIGIREEDWPDTPEGIAAWLQWYDSLEPIEMTPQQEAEWQAARKAQR